MSTADYPLLFSPIQLGHVEARNRIVSTSHGTNLAANGAPSPREIAYHEAKARGGCGTVMMFGSAAASPLTPMSPDHVNLFDDAALPGLREAAAAVKAHGALAISQVTSYGRRSRATIDLTGYGPSAYGQRDRAERAACPLLQRDPADDRALRRGVSSTQSLRVRRLRSGLLRRSTPRPVLESSHQPASGCLRRIPGKPHALLARGAGGGACGRRARLHRRGARLRRRSLSGRVRSRRADRHHRPSRPDRTTGLFHRHRRNDLHLSLARLQHPLGLFPACHLHRTLAAHPRSRACAGDRDRTHRAAGSSGASAA